MAKKYVSKKDSMVQIIIKRNARKMQNDLNNTSSVLKKTSAIKYTKGLTDAKNNIFNGGSLDAEVRRLTKASKQSTIMVNGKNWKYDKYTKMLLRNECKSTAINSSFRRAEEMGNDLIEVSTFTDGKTRENCLEDQGKVYSISGESGTVIDFTGNQVKFTPWSNTSFGLADGLFGVNCRHQSYPFFAKEYL